MRLFLVGPSPKTNPEVREVALAASARLGTTGHSIDMSFLENPSAQIKFFLSQSISADAFLLLPGWQANPDANLLVEVSLKLAIPMFIEKEGKLKPRIEVIGVSGYARAGKDTIGDYLVELGYERASFAAPIRKALYTLNPYLSNSKRTQGIIDEHGWEGSKTVDPEVRLLLQRLGSDVGRAMIDNDIWVDLTLKGIPDGAKVVFTDCRFPNEAAAIKRFGGELWRVSRIDAKPANNHISEIALDDWHFDARFENNSTIEELHQTVAKRLK